MKITKFGHCCLLIEVNGLRILTDPGTYSTTQNEVKDIDVVLITHEHQDHFHVESVKQVLKNNPKAKVVTNTTVGGLLQKEGITFSIVEDGQKTNEGGVSIEGMGKFHAMLHSSISQSQNTGYFISERLFYPGDAFTDPKRKVDILALPCAGPWMKISEAIDYALLVKPKTAFPVHDGILKSAGLSQRLPSMILPQNGIDFVPMVEGDTKEF